MPKIVQVPFSLQQLSLLKSIAIDGGLATDYQAAVLMAIDEAPDFEEGAATYSSAIGRLPIRQTVEEHVLQPGAGKALVVRKGEVLRVQQIAGGQCVDFNCFNLHDRRETLHIARTRLIHGLSPCEGHLLWSKSPWERPMMAIIAGNAVTDTLYPFCSARVYSLFYGIDAHTNCHQIQAEAQREYGLATHEVHDTLNLFMHVTVEDGVSKVVRNGSRAGDFIDLYALMDVLAVCNICGDDYGRVSNFAFKDARILRQTATADDLEAAALAIKPFPEAGFDQITAGSEVQALKPDPHYVPAFSRCGVAEQEIAVTLSPKQESRLEIVRDYKLYASDEGASVRDITMSWIKRQMETAKEKS